MHATGHANYKVIDLISLSMTWEVAVIHFLGLSPQLKIFVSMYGLDLM